MIIKRNHEASLSIFFSLLILTMMSLIFSMVETVRVYAMEIDSTAITHMSLESGFSEYNPYIWSKYKILGVDRSEGTGQDSNAPFEEQMVIYGKNNSDLSTLKLSIAGTNFLRMATKEAAVTEYGLLTDSGGAAVIEQGSSMALGAMGAFGVDKLKEYMIAIPSLDGTGVEGKIGKYAEAVSQANEEIERRKKANKESTDGSYEELPEDDYLSGDKNPINAFMSFKSSFSDGSLGMYLDTASVSTKSVDSSTLASNRLLNQGNVAAPAISEADKLLYIIYLLNNFSTFRTRHNVDGLNYEIEHVLIGKGDDSLNLAGVCGRLFAFRLAENAIALASSASAVKVQAHALAEALFSWFPILIPIVALAIEAMMIFAESVLDVRALLAGRQISAIKTASEWTFDIWDSPRLADISFMSKECASGIKYENYLAIMIAIEGLEKLGLRSIDCMEVSLNTKTEYSNVKFDNLYYRASIDMDYEAKPLFLSLVTIGDNSIGGYGFSKSSEINYLQKVDMKISK